MKKHINEMELLSAYIDGQLTPHEQKRVNAALAASAEVRQEMEKLLHSKSLVQALPTPSIPTDLLASLHAMANETSSDNVIPFYSVKRNWMWAGSFAAAAGLLIAVWVGLTPQKTIPFEALMEAHGRVSADLPFPQHVLGAGSYSASGGQGDAKI